MRISTPYTARPCLVITSSWASPLCSSCLFLRWHTVPSGDISVMPQACSTVTPNSSRNALIIAGGHAEPPITVRFIVDSFRPSCFM